MRGFPAVAFVPLVLICAGYSFSDATGTSTTDGTSTTFQASVPMKPAMKQCARITVVTRKVKAKGLTQAWVCAAGWIGTHQGEAKHVSFGGGRLKG